MILRKISYDPGPTAIKVRTICTASKPAENLSRRRKWFFLRLEPPPFCLPACLQGEPMTGGGEGKKGMTPERNWLPRGRALHVHALNLRHLGRWDCARRLFHPRPPSMCLASWNFALSRFVLEGSSTRSLLEGSGSWDDVSSLLFLLSHGSRCEQSSLLAAIKHRSSSIIRSW